MKMATRILLSILALLVVIVCLITIVQWDNIKALYIAKTHSSQEIEEMLDKNSDIRKKAVSGLPVRELTEEEQEEIKSGKLGSEEALDRILDNSENVENNEDLENSGTQQSAEEDYDAELAKLVGQIYVLESTYSGTVDSLVSNAIAEYKALPPEQHTDANKWDIAVKYLGQAYAMESSCDQQMATILSQIEGVLVKSGGDLSFVDQIKSAYESEKILQKDYYLSLYS